MERRHFVRLGMTAAWGCLFCYAAAQTKVSSGIKLGTFFPGKPSEDDIAMLRHAGVDAVSIWTSIANNTAAWMISTGKKLGANSVQVYNIGIIDLHCYPALVLSTPGAGRKIAQYKAYLNNLGRAGIGYTTYAHMSNIKNQPTPGFYQTSIGKTRGGADTREFDLDADRKLPCSFDTEYRVMKALREVNSLRDRVNAERGRA